MSVKRKVRRIRGHFDRYKIEWIFVFCAVLFLGFLFRLNLQSDYPEITPYVVPTAALTSELAEENAHPQRERQVYPYSVIPGGVRNPKELAVKIGDDRVVASHYADFNVSKATIVQTAETRFLYVSYRLKNKIYWTAQKIKIPQGEPVITDGRCEARARCGNRISASPLAPISKEEPALESFDVPEMTPLSVPPLSVPPLLMIEPFAPPLTLKAPVISSYKGAQPIYYSSHEITRSPYYYRPIFQSSLHASVPEPSSLSLLLMGVIIVIVCWFIQSR